MSSVGSTPSSAGSSSSQSAASTAASSVDNSSFVSPSSSAASTPSVTPASSVTSSPNQSPGSSVASSPASTAPTTPSNSRPSSPTPKPETQTQLSEPQPTSELEIPDNDALRLLLAKVEKYAEMSCRADDQQTVAGQAIDLRKVNAPPGGVLPKRFHQRTKEDQESRIVEKIKETLLAISGTMQKFKLGMYDNDNDDTIDDKSHPDQLGIRGKWWECIVSQAMTNQIAEGWTGTDKPEEVASQQFTSSTTGRTIVETNDLKRAQPALGVLADLVNTVNPYSAEDQKIYTQFPESLRNMIRTGYDMVDDMVDHSEITPWPVGDKRVYTEERDGKTISWTSAMRPPAKFDTLGAGESLYVQSQRQHLHTVRKFASRVGFVSTKRDSTNTQTQSSHTSTLPENVMSNNGPPNASKKPSGVSFVEPSQTADPGTSADGGRLRRHERTSKSSLEQASTGPRTKREKRDKEIREVFERHLRKQTSQNGASCAQESGYGQTGLAQTRSLASCA